MKSIPQSRLQYTAPVSLRERKAPSAKLAPFCLSGKTIMSLAGKGAYPQDQPLIEKQVRQLREANRTPRDRAQYLRDYMKRRRQEQNQLNNTKGSL